MPQFQSPMQAQAQALNLKQLQQQTQLRQQEIQQGQNTLADQQKVSALYQDRAKNIDPDTGLPTTEALLQSGASPAIIQKMTQASQDAKAKKELSDLHKSEAAKNTQKERQDAIQQVREDSMAAYQGAAQLGPQAAKEAGQKVFAEGINGLKKSGLFSQEDAAKMQTEFDPVRVSSRLIGYKEQLQMAEKQKADDRADKSQSERERHDKETERMAGAREDRLIGALAAKNNPASVIPPQHADLHGEDYLSTVPAGLKSTIKAIAEGRSTYADLGIRGKDREAMVERVNQYDPSFDAPEARSRFKAIQDFSTGKNGNTVRSLNVSIDHLGTLQKAADALQNGNIQVFNKLGNAIASATGQPAPTDFTATKKIVADEIVKGIIGSGGGVTDREEAAKSIDGANSPAQLTGVINRYKDLLGGQLHGLKKQYEDTTKRTDFESRLTPEAKAQLMGRDGKKTVTAAPAAAIQHLKDNPALKDAFKAKYGYLPEGM